MNYGAYSDEQLVRLLPLIYGAALTGLTLLAALLVRTLVSLFHNMGLQVVAEGVEAAPQAEALARYGADRIQGYYYARPMPESELIPFLKEKNHAPRGGAKEVLV